MTHAKLEQAFARGALERAHAARLGEDLEASLSELLAAWGVVRDPLLADAIDLLSAEALALELRPPVSDETQWFSRAMESPDPIEVARLLTKIPRRNSLLGPGLRALLRAPPDPRLAAAAMRSFQRGNPSMVLHPGLRAHLDPAYRSALRELVDVDPRLRRVLDATERLLALRSCELDAGGRRWLDALLQRAPAPSCADQRELALLRELAASPDDLGPRCVYADHRLARGPDPHAEFVILQLRALAGELSDDARVRMEALLREHGQAWLGRLGAALEPASLEWRAGFGYRGTLRRDRHGDALPAHEQRWIVEHPGSFTFAELGGLDAELEAERLAP